MINTETHRDRTNPLDIINVATYGRVSTEHEAQINAMQNQIQFYDTYTKTRPNWNVVENYVDEGITGTVDEKRPAFMKMIEDAKAGKFSLIVTREVSRFFRNLELSIRYTRKLREGYGVEIFFVSDNIWSMDPTDDFKLGLMSLIAETESQKTGARVLAGQKISRDNGIIYGNGNVMGYKLCVGKKSNENYYEIDEDQAATVKRIFHLYLNEGMGMKKISTQLVKEKRKNASGLVRWDVSRVSRILGNKLYCGYLTYNKSKTLSSITHKRVNNSDRSTYMYVKSDKVPVIIPEEEWNKVQELRGTRLVYDPKSNSMHPKNAIEDIWKQKLICECGSTFKKYKWRVNKETNAECFGYQCQNVVRNRKKEFREKQGIEDNEGYCNMKSIADWKLQYMAICVFKALWKSPGKTINKIMKILEKHYDATTTQCSPTLDKKKQLQEEKEHINRRIKNLLEMRLEGSIKGEEYKMIHSDMTKRIAEIESELSTLEAENPTVKIIDLDSKKENLLKLKDILKQIADLYGKTVDDRLISCFVRKIVVKEGFFFEWYIDLTTSDKSFDEKDYVMYKQFKISYNEAQEFRKANGSFLRKNQWENLKVKVFVSI